MDPPTSPRKRLAELQRNPVPSSPDMSRARNHLDHLLSGIRRGDGPSSLAYRDETTFDQPGTEEEPRRGPGRPRKPRREKRVVFELRGKSFALRDLDKADSVYALCRKWLYGRDDEPVIPQIEDIPPITEQMSLDLMATKPIFIMPPPLYHIPIEHPYPLEVPEFQSKHSSNTELSAEEMMAEHTAHWKNVRKTFNDYAETRRKRYQNSVHLLRTVFGIAQQTQ